MGLSSLSARQACRCHTLMARIFDGLRRGVYCAHSMSKWLLIGLPAITAFAQVAAPDTAAGKKIFESQCALCHGQTGTGGRGPSLNRAKLAKAPDDEALWKLISTGIEPEMP